MYFEPGGIYHIYNQGNNRQKIFYNHENYEFFVWKIRNHILPFTDILAWCLMPNHFHLMVEVRAGGDSVSEGFTPSEALTTARPGSEALTQTDTNHTNAANGPESIAGSAFPNAATSLNYSIGVLLRSYTRAINIQENSTGSLFRKKTKAICLNQIQEISSHWYTSFGTTFMKADIPEYRYPQVCFNYIHANPVRAGLVKRAEDWKFSSYIDLVGMRAGSLVNRKRVEELGLIV